MALTIIICLTVEYQSAVQYTFTGAVAGGQGGHGPQFFRNRRIFGNFNASSENVRTFAVGKGRGFEFYRKIIELGPPTLQVP